METPKVKKKHFMHKNDGYMLRQILEKGEIEWKCHFCQETIEKFKKVAEMEQYIMKFLREGPVKCKKCYKENCFRVEKGYIVYEGIVSLNRESKKALRKEVNSVLDKAKKKN